jgi:enediyne biosynthesis protein CalE5
MNASGAPDPAQVKEGVRQEWVNNSIGWRKWYPQFAIQSRAATEAIVEAAQVRPGMRVLDLASGTGEPALTLAAAVAPDGHVTATDLVPEMLATAEEVARERGLDNISFKQADAEDLPFPDESFDVVTCRFGVMFFPDPARALREVRRVLKPDGRVALLAWGPREQNPYVSAAADVLSKRVQLPPPAPDAPQPFRFAEPGALAAQLEAAGFRQVREERRAIPWPWPGTVEQFWEAIREFGPTVRRLLAEMPPEQVEEAEAEVFEAIGRYYDGRQVNFPALVVLVTGER